MKTVLLVWEDAAEIDAETWVERESAKKPEPVIFHQVGYLYALTPFCVVLTACVGESHMGARTQVPIGMVRKLVELTEGEPVKIPKRRKT